MATHECMLLVRMLKYQRNLSPPELERVAEWAGQCVDHRNLLEQLVSERVVEQEWADRARTYLRSKARSRVGEHDELSRFDRSFGQIALERELIDVGQLEAALLEQERLRRRNLHFRIGEILVKTGSLEISAVRAILREQGIESRQCRSCEAVVSVPPSGPGAAAENRACPACGGELDDARFLEIVRADL